MPTTASTTTPERLPGGISVGQGEFATPYVAGGAANSAPGSCSNGTGWLTNQHLPYCLQLEVNVHNNYVTSNSSLGDELFSATLAGGGGVTFCTGNDYYKFNYNWVCGNLSTGEGGGLVHLGEIQYGDIEHNSIVFNQSQNPTIPTNGGGIQVMGTPDTDPVCVGIPDADCPPGLSDGSGHGLMINANLIQGNSADSGSGGGIRLQQVNGTDVSTFNTQPKNWNGVSITNNMIVNNVAGWDGAGISLQDSLNVSIINNTISSNDSLATSGVLTQSIGTPLSSAPAGNCVQPGPTGPTSASCPQSAGVTSMQNSSLLTTTFTGITITCPTGEPNCAGFSNPLLQNNVIWQNRSFYIGVGKLGTGTVNQQNIVTLFDAFTGTAAPVQTAFGQCSTGVSYWDIGVRGDTGPSNHGSGFSLSPTYSVLDDPADYSTGHNLGTNPGIVSQYCNGSRVPPTCSVADGCGGPSGYGVPPGIVDASTPNPVFSLTPSATVDEGNNWINVSWGPVAPSNDSVAGGANGNYGGGPLFANYSLGVGSSAIDYVPLTATTLPTATNPALTTDFFGNVRPDPSNPTHFDVGAVEFQGSNAPPSFVSVSPNTGYRGTTVAVTITGTNFGGLQSVTVSGAGVTVSNAVATSTTITANFTITATAGLTSRNVVIVTGGGTVTATGAFTVLGPSLTSINPTSGARATTVPVTLTGADLQGATAVTMSGAGITCTVTGTPTATTVNASCVITGTAALTARNVTVATPDGNATLTAAFTVGGGPTVTNINPAAGARGTTVPVTITGTNLSGATAVTMSGAGITCTISGTSTATTVNASCVITAAAGLTARNVTVATAAGNAVLTAGFEVTGATLAFSAPSPVLTSTPANTTAKTGTITVSNTATGVTAGPVTLTAAPALAAKTGNGTGAFSITGGTCANGTVINPGGNCTVVVTYTPLTSGTNDTANATTHVTITGTGLAAAANGAAFNAN